MWRYLTEGKEGMETQSRALIVLAGVMFVTLVLGMVVLAVVDADLGSLERIGGPLLTAVIVTGVLGGAHRGTSARLDEMKDGIDKKLDDLATDDDDGGEVGRDRRPGAHRKRP